MTLARGTFGKHFEEENCLFLTHRQAPKVRPFNPGTPCITEVSHSWQLLSIRSHTLYSQQSADGSATLFRRKEPVRGEGGGDSTPWLSIVCWHHYHAETIKLVESKSSVTLVIKNNPAMLPKRTVTTELRCSKNRDSSIGRKIVLKFYQTNARFFAKLLLTTRRTQMNCLDDLKKLKFFRRESYFEYFSSVQRGKKNMLGILWRFRW